MPWLAALPSAPSSLPPTQPLLLLDATRRRPLHQHLSSATSPLYAETMSAPATLPPATARTPSELSTAGDEEKALSLKAGTDEGQHANNHEIVSEVEGPLAKFSRHLKTLGVETRSLERVPEDQRDEVRSLRALVCCFEKVYADHWRARSCRSGASPCDRCARTAARPRSTRAALRARADVLRCPMLALSSATVLSDGAQVRSGSRGCRRGQDNALTSSPALAARLTSAGHVLVFRQLQCFMSCYRLSWQSRTSPPLERVEK